MLHSGSRTQVGLSALVRMSKVGAKLAEIAAPAAAEQLILPTAQFARLTAPSQPPRATSVLVAQP